MPLQFQSQEGETFRQKRGLSNEIQAFTGDAETERYLDSLVARLDFLPIERRTEIRLEASGHLESLRLAFIELGHTPEEASALARERFGNGKTQAEQLRAEWKAFQRSNEPNEAFRFAFNCIGTAILRDSLLATILIFGLPFRFFVFMGVSETSLMSFYSGLQLPFLFGWYLVASPLITARRIARETGSLAIGAILRGSLGVIVIAATFALVGFYLKNLDYELQMYTMGTPFAAYVRHSNIELFFSIPLWLGVAYQIIRVPMMCVGVGLENYRQRRRCTTR